MMLLRMTSCLMLLAPAIFSQAQPSIAVDGGNGKTITLTAADLASLPQQTIKASDRGTAATFEGVLVSDVMAKVEAPVGEKLRGKALAQYLLVEAADGYRAVFALADLDPAFSDRRIYLITRRDGKALSEKEVLSAVWVGQALVCRQAGLRVPPPGETACPTKTTLSRADV